MTCLWKYAVKDKNQYKGRTLILNVLFPEKWMVFIDKMKRGQHSLNRREPISHSEIEGIVLVVFWNHWDATLWWVVLRCSLPTSRLLVPTVSSHMAAGRACVTHRIWQKWWYVGSQIKLRRHCGLCLCLFLWSFTPQQAAVALWAALRRSPHGNELAPLTDSYMTELGSRSFDSVQPSDDFSHS